MRILALTLVLACTLTACTQNNTANNNASGDPSTGGDAAATTMQLPDSAGANSNAFIRTDTANKMISSYLTSVGAPTNDSNLRSIIIDANALRSYLTSEGGNKITTMKLMFAHTLDYINAGNTGKNCGYKTRALTIVLAGIDSAGNYVRYSGSQVMDNGWGCPHTCPTQGTSKNDLLPE